MSPLFDDLNRMKNFRRNEKKNQPTRWSKYRKTGTQHQREGVQRPGCRVIVVGIYDSKPAGLGLRTGNAVKMSVNDPGMVVIRPAGMHMLKRRQDESQHEGEACR